MAILFSYGTLQRPEVQRAAFGRSLEGRAAELVGWALGTFRVADPAFVASSGTAEHAIVRYTGCPADRVRGTALEVTEAELAAADAYEPAGYARVAVTLASGEAAWVYAAAEG